MFHDDRGERDYPRERRRFQRDDRRPSDGERVKPMLTRERIERQVYCHNLPFRSSWQDLKDFMRAAGDVEYVKIMEGQNGRSRGCAVVTYINKEGARKAVETLNGTEFHGRTMVVQEDQTNTFTRPNEGGMEQQGGRYRPNYRNRYDDDQYYNDRSSRGRERYRQRSRSPPPRSYRPRRYSPPPEGDGRDHRGGGGGGGGSGGGGYRSRRSYSDDRYVPDKMDSRRD